MIGTTASAASIAAGPVLRRTDGQVANLVPAVCERAARLFHNVLAVGCVRENEVVLVAVIQLRLEKSTLQIGALRLLVSQRIRLPLTSDS